MQAGADTRFSVFPRLRGQVAAQHLLLQTMGGRLPAYFGAGVTLSTKQEPP